MPRKKKDEVEETTSETTEVVGTEETAVGAAAEDAAPVEVAPAGDDDLAAAEADAPVEKKGKKAAKAFDEPAQEEEPSIFDSVIEAAAGVAETVAVTIGKGAANLVSAITPAPAIDATVKIHKRAEKIGIVSSDKMMKTVTVRVDRLVKHPVYRKYVRKRKKFMAHDETGAKIGDKVRIVETRPLSARKRWRVVEIIQKAEL